MIKTIFFGANDACVPSSSTGQHIPLEEYVQNLKTLVDHSSVKAHSPHILLITPPPVDEYTLEGMDYMNNNGDTEVKRRAAVTKTYADACRKLGEELGIEVVDIWNTIVTKAGWTPGQPLPGSKDMPRSPVLGELFRDGELPFLEENLSS